MNSGSQKTFKTTTFIFWIALAAIVVMMAVYAYFFHTVRSIGEHNAALSAEATTLEDQASQAGDLKKSLSLIQARQPVLASYFIDAADIVPFLETIEGYGRQTNITTKFSTFVFKRAPDMLAVTMTADGSFTDLYHFMALLEAAPYEISMTDVSVEAQSPKGLQAEGSATGAAGWEAQISLAVTSITNVPKDAPKVAVPKK